MQIPSKAPSVCLSVETSRFGIFWKKLSISIRCCLTGHLPCIEWVSRHLSRFLSKVMLLCFIPWSARALTQTLTVTRWRFIFRLALRRRSRLKRLSLRRTIFSRRRVVRRCLVLHRIWFWATTTSPRCVTIKRAKGCCSVIRLKRSPHGKWVRLEYMRRLRFASLRINAYTARTEKAKAA